MYPADERAADPNPSPSRLTRRSYLAAGASVAATTVAVGAGWGRAAASTMPPASGAEAAGAGGVDSAEGAVEAYLAALAGADLDAAISAFAIVPYVDGYDFTAMLERISAYTGNADLPIPPSNPLNRAFMIEARRARVTGRILDQYFALAHPTFDRYGATVILGDEAAVGAFVAEFDAELTPVALEGLGDHEFVALANIDAETAQQMTAEPSIEREERRRAVIGADEFASLAVRTTVDGEPVTLLFEAVRYGDRWWVNDLGNTFAQLLNVDIGAAGVLRDGAGSVDDSGAADVTTTPATTTA